MHTRLLTAGLLLALAGLTGLARGGDDLVFFGTHNAGATRGFYEGHFDTATGKLTVPAFEARSDSCGYFVIAPDGKHLYTCNSVANFGGAQHMGAVSAFALDPGTGKLALLNQLPSAGEDPSYISLDHTGKYALVANYQGNRVPGEGGTVAVFSINADGSFGKQTAFDQHRGTSIDPSRQKQAYAHSIIVDPSNKFALCPDLGLDKVFIYKFDAHTGGLAPNEPPFAAVKPGSGPRHAIFHPNGKIVYVIHEIGSMITAFHWDGDKGTLAAFQEISTLPPDFKGTDTSAEIKISADGKYVYASNRGEDAIAQFTVDPATFKLAFVQAVPSGGKTPRNMELDPSGRWLMATNQDSNNAVVFRIDPASGKLTQQGEPVAVNYPFCPRFLAPSPQP